MRRGKRKGRGPRSGQCRFEWHVRRRAAIALLAGLCGVLAAGCEPGVSLKGLVTDIDGEPLPGVSVKVEALQAFGVSNGNGVFGGRPNLVSVPPGTWELRYIKTGYTTVHQTITTGTTRASGVPPVALWPLPPAKGVYAFDNTNYLAFTRATPDRYRRQGDSAPVFGLKQKPELVLQAAPDLIISYDMVNYDWQISRLEQVEVLRHGVTVTSDEIPDSLKETVWAAAADLPIQAIPIDQPEQLLWRIRTSIPMGPGRYAVHWGALGGDVTTEESVYLFEIADPNAEIAVQGDENGAVEGGEEVEPAAEDAAAPEATDAA